HFNIVLDLDELCDTEWPVHASEAPNVKEVDTLTFALGIVVDPAFIGLKSVYQPLQNGLALGGQLGLVVPADDLSCIRDGLQVVSRGDKKPHGVIDPRRRLLQLPDRLRLVGLQEHDMLRKVLLNLENLLKHRLVNTVQ